MIRRIRPYVVVLSNRPLFDSFFTRKLQDRLGDFPAIRLLSTLSGHGYERYVSFEWEKRWHPAIPEPEIALPHFARWVRRALVAGSS